MDTIRRRGFAVAAMAGALAAALVASPAAADVTDGPWAIVTNTGDQLTAAATPPDPNVTCDVTAGGRDLVQRTNYVFGEVYGQDFGTAHGECVSLDRNRGYDCDVTVTIQYFSGGRWIDTPASASGSGNAFSGVCGPVAATALGTYAGGSMFLNRYHRAHATLAVSIPGVPVRHAYSPVWFMFP